MNPLEAAVLEVEGRVAVLTSKIDHYSTKYNRDQ
jgi:hypothetical protein